MAARPQSWAIGNEAAHLDLGLEIPILGFEVEESK
jgi:hypothetical protein